MRITVIGNGSIGTYTALKVLKDYPNAEITLIGNLERKWAASTAAGAMANVYAEMEKSTGYVHETNLKYLEMGKFGSAAWMKFLSETDGMQAVTSPDTYVYLKKAHSDFEAQNFNAVVEIAAEDGVLNRLTREEIVRDFPSFASTTISEAIRINGEFTFSVSNLFEHLDKLVNSSTIKLIKENVGSIDVLNKVIHIRNSEESIVNFDKLIVCAGARTSELFSKNTIMPVFQGVGVAILLDEIKNIEIQKLNKGVYRSVNRGGAQCGIHLVPRENGKFYLGAGNYVSKIEDPKIRLDTIRYLLETLSEDLIGKNLGYELTGEFKIGLRPRALDGFPMIGPISASPDVFIATATNRAGLTWAPYIASQISNWIANENLDTILVDWSPDRKPIPFGSAENGVNYFTESRISNALEHRLIPRAEHEIAAKRIEFDAVGRKLCADVNKKIGMEPSLSVNPDNWSAIISS